MQIRDSNAPYVLLGWELSYFSGKARAYLRYKRIPYVEKSIDLFGFRVQAQRRTGAAAIPIVITPDGRWLQDSSAIIDALEARFPERPIVPTTPVHRFVAYLLELWGGEFWIPAGMHTRWSHAENYPLFEREVGGQLLPGFPRAIQNHAAAYAANMMRAHLPNVGIVPEQFAVLDTWIDVTLDALEAHFRQHPYLLGGRPSLADFGLVAPLHGHLGRDPWPKRELIAKRPNVRAYIDRMAQPPRDVGALCAGDEIPDTLAPIVASVLREMWPLIEGTRNEVLGFRTTSPRKKRVPRGLGFVEHPLGHGRFRRAALPYVLWMYQRMRDAFEATTSHEKDAVRAMLSAYDAMPWVEVDVPRVERVGLRVALVEGGHR